jgi:GT2 family glycosyltransferase
MLNILTLTWNKCDSLAKLKESLIPALEGIDYTWFIKDNASVDNTYDVASTWGDKVKVVKYKDNAQNFAEGMNYLFNLAAPNDNDYVLLLNNDVEFGDKTSVKRMMGALKDDIAVVGAKLLFTGTNKLQHAGVVFNSHQLPIHFRRYELDDANSSKDRLFQAVTGAVMLVKASDYKAICQDNASGVKGLCEKLIWCFDDIDACLSIVKNTKKKILYCGDTKIFHEESASLKKNPVNKLYMQHNVSFFLNKWRKTYVPDLDRYTLDPKYNLYK